VLSARNAALPTYQASVPSLIGLMVDTFARVGAAIQMRVEDVYIQGRRTWVRLTHQFHTLAVRLATVAA
jgi:integrase